MSYTKKQTIEMASIAYGVLEAASREDWDLAHERLVRLMQFKQSNPPWLAAVGVILRYALFRMSGKLPGGPFVGYTWPAKGLIPFGTLAANLSRIEMKGNYPGIGKYKKRYKGVPS